MIILAGMNAFIIWVKPPLKQRIIYLIAFGFSIAVAVQSSEIIGGNIEFNLNHIVVFTINYLTWATVVPSIYGNLVDLANNKKEGLSRWSSFIGRLGIILVMQFFASNLVYYIYLFSTTNYGWELAIQDFQLIYLRIFVSRSIDLLVIIGFLKVIENFTELSRQKIKLADLQNQLSISELDALKAQMNPHFLFNSLHAVHALIGFDDKKAKSMIIKISNLLRKNLTQKNKQFIPLSEEMEYLAYYMEIEQERFHDRLNISTKIDNDANKILVPNLFLQPLIENAFKHGISLLEGSGEIKIRGSCSPEGRLNIVVENTVPNETKVTEVPSFGIGLSNLKKRFEQSYGINYQLKTEYRNERFIVELNIPQKT